jgi:uncharacterized protein (TIGR03790 family)
MGRVLRVIGVAAGVVWLGGYGGSGRQARGLEPDDIVVLFNARSPNSLRVARYYMKARSIPANHLIAVTCDSHEIVSEEFYRRSFVPQVTRALNENKLSPKCLVTTYDVPLRIAARHPSPEERAELEADKKALAALLQELQNEIASYNSILPQDAAATVPATGPAPSTQPLTVRQLIPRLNTAASAAGVRIEKAEGTAKRDAFGAFMKIQQSVAGAGGILRSLRISGTGPDADRGRQQLTELSAQVRDMEQQYASLLQQRDKPDVRRQLIELRRKSQGKVGEAFALQENLAYLQPEGTEACLDSELALVLSDQKYPRGNWIPNPKNLELYPTMQHMKGVPPTVMVSRIDGLTVKQVQDMIDTTLRVEKQGLEGKLYLDARGLHGSDAYSLYDADLRRASEWLKEHSTIDVVLDDAPALLTAQNAPDAALYCGWYSLHNYQESGQWVKGAVGYHVASYEMPTLHNEKETGWVTNLLSRGFCGTLGATDEPYLSAFPKPSLFFPLLLSGEFTQGEVYEVTNPMLSWRIGFVGDPLYNPFKARPRVKVDDVKADVVLRNAFAILRDRG